jgi:hypothetical protein
MDAARGWALSGVETIQNENIQQYGVWAELKSVNMSIYVY